MPNQESTWKTVSGKPKTKPTVTSNKSSGSNNSAPTIPQAEVKTIKLSDSAFSAMKERITDEDEEKENPGNTTKPVVNNQEKNAAPKQIKPPNPKISSNSLTLKQALQNINIDKFKTLNSSTKEQTPLHVEKVSYWFVEQLKDVTSGFHDPTFSKETNPEYPIHLLPSKTREYFDHVFNDSKWKFKGISLCQNGLLQQNADLNLVGGYQILLQYLFRSLDENDVETLINDNEQLASSFKRIPSDKVLRLLWAYGQLQYVHVTGALQSWFDLMFPLIENRTYNQFVIDNISQITSRNINNKKFYRVDEQFPVEELLRLIEFVDRPNPALTKELRTSLTTSTKILSDLFIINAKNLSRHGDEYFRLIFPFLSGDKTRSSRSQTIIDQMIRSSMVNSIVVKIWLELHEENPQCSPILLSILQTEGTSLNGLSTGKDIRNLVEKLLQISNGKRKVSEHRKFLEAYGKEESQKIKRRSKSKSSKFSVFKWIFLLTVLFLVYRNWLWLTVATDYFLEDYMKHPTAIAVKEKFQIIYDQGNIFKASAISFALKYTGSTIEKLQPYTSKLGEIFQKQMNAISKYLEGPGYEKMIQVADEIQRVSMIIFNQSVRYLNIFFENASVYTAKLADSTSIYVKKLYVLVDDQWTKTKMDRRFDEFGKYLRNFDFSKLREKVGQIFLLVVKSV